MSWGDNIPQGWISFDQEVTVRIDGTPFQELSEYNGEKRNIYVVAVTDSMERQMRMRCATRLISAIKDADNDPLGKWFRINRTGTGFKTKYSVIKLGQQDIPF